ncbi:hypothetical protein K438DRAFT_1772756 [Mycena galopus ATCC 62051]|nr:hypothetical protein K438DRAFT_1772756 [Mycena galopus ATCC 62051]
MILASLSESSSLAAQGQKRKAQAHELDPVAIYKHVMERLRQEHLFVAHEKDDWNAVTAKMLEDPSLPNPILSRPFTDANPFYIELFEAEPVTEIYAAEDINPSAPLDITYEAAATALEQNVLWQGVREHIVHASCRTAIDMVVLTAIDLAQKEIEQQTSVDEDLRANHSLSALKSSFLYGPPVHSWVILHQEVSIPDQQMLPSLALHGMIDYLVEIISAIDARLAARDDGFFMRRKGMADHLQSSLLSIMEANSDSTFHSDKSWAKLAAQGAALCVMTRPALEIRPCFQEETTGSQAKVDTAFCQGTAGGSQSCAIHDGENPGLQYCRTPGSRSSSATADNINPVGGGGF